MSIKEVCRSYSMIHFIAGAVVPSDIHTCAPPSPFLLDQEERNVAEALAEYIWPLPNPAVPGEATHRSVFNGLLINNQPASIREDHQ